MELGSKIREVRLQKKMTQKDVVGDYMTRNMLSKIENGSATPSVKTLAYLAQALDLPVGHFMDDPQAAGERAGDRGGLSAPEQLDEIDGLADLLMGEGSPLIRAAALCLKARVLLASRDAEGALALLETVQSGSLPPEALDAQGRDLICKAMEDCCAQMGDYKKAYDLALKRMNRDM